MKTTFAILAAVGMMVLASDVNADSVRDGGGDRRVVGPHSSVVYHTTFRAGVPAAVAVHGDGSTDLDLYVYDPAGNLVGCDVDYTDDCLVLWTPQWTGRCTIIVKNNGPISNYYGIGTN
jgi:hypothetical protein